MTTIRVIPAPDFYSQFRLVVYLSGKNKDQQKLVLVKKYGFLP